MRFVPLMFILLIFAGCSAQSGDSLLSPPNLPAEYVQLEKQLDSIRAQGAQYIVAETGTDRQSVQLVDLDTDGYNEAVAFFMMDDGVLRVYMFEYDSGGYYQIGYIEGAGARRLYSAEFIDYAPGGRLAVALSWSYDETENRGLTVCRYDGSELRTILQTQYKGILYTDGDGDGDVDIYTATVNDVTGAHRMRRFQLGKDGDYIQNLEVPMCSEVRSILSMQRGGDGLLYIDSAAHGGGYVTDVISGELNLTMDDIIGSGSSTYRQAAVFCTDIDGDGLIEVPMVEKVGSGRIGWYRFDISGNQGEKLLAADTYFSIADGWYIFWPDKWQDSVSSQRTVSNGVAMTTFYVPVTAGTMEEVRNALLTVYVFSGDQSADTLQSYSGVKVIQTVGTTIYAYKIMQNDFPEYSMSDWDMTRLFNIIEASSAKEGY